MAGVHVIDNKNRKRCCFSTSERYWSPLDAFVYSLCVPAQLFGSTSVLYSLLKRKKTVEIIQKYLCCEKDLMDWIRRHSSSLLTLVVVLQMFVINCDVDVLNSVQREEKLLVHETACYF